MSVKQNFLTCIAENLAEFGYGKKRTEDVQENFEGLYRKYTEREGMTPLQAATRAQDDVYNRMLFETVEKNKRAQKSIEVALYGKERMDQASGIKTFGKGSIGTKTALAVQSLIEMDPRVQGLNAIQVIESYRQKMLAMMSGELEKFGKGLLGRAKASVESMDNVARELYGEATGDTAAKAMADAFTKVNNIAVDDFNAAGGSLSKRQNYRLPQRQNAVKVTKLGEAEWTRKMDKWLAWDRMEWPDGSPIDVSERPDFLKFVYSTLSSDGANKIDPSAMRGRGAAVGNQLDKNRLLEYKDGASWLEMHRELGDGTVYDVITGHIDSMAHKVGMVKMFGPNPKMAFEQIKMQGRKQLANDPAALADFDGRMKTRVEPMFEVLTRQNAVDPNSTMAAITSSTSNILTSAQLGSAAIMAVGGDLFSTTVPTLLARGRAGGVFDFLGAYAKGMVANPGEFRAMAAQAGFVFDGLVSNTYAVQRFSGVASYGPAWTSHVSDAVMRASLMSKHTDVARNATRFEAMGYLQRTQNVELKNHAFEGVMRRYGITDDDWNAIRSLQASELEPGARFLTPRDILNSDLPNKSELYAKYFSLIDGESRVMVPGTTLEAQTFLKGTTRPDTFLGVIAQSFSAYKNFPVSMPLIYGRQLLAQETGRFGMAMALGVGMIGVGAIGTQLRNIAQGKQPQPMDTPSFWAKSIAAGGALSIWGDIITTGATGYGQGPADIIAGPLAGLLKDTAALTLGDPFKWVAQAEKGAAFQGKFGSRAVDYAKRYTPGTNIWYTRLAMERWLWDNLDKYVDPAEAANKQRRKENKLRQDFGTEYYWRPGQNMPN